LLATIEAGWWKAAIRRHSQLMADSSILDCDYQA
jgi:hypothetical protein